MAAAAFFNAAKLADAIGRVSPLLGNIFRYLATMVTGADDKIVTGTAGTSGNVVMWNADGDAVDGSVAASSLTTEAIQDLVGAMVTGNTETGITVTYQDADGTLDFEVTGTHDAVTLAGTPDYITLSGQQITRGLIDLATDVTGALPAGNGGNPAAGCAFLAYNSADDTNVTGDATLVTVECDTEVYDVGSNFDNSTDTFTAPATGKYRFNVTVRAGGFTAAADLVIVSIVTSNRTYAYAWLRTNQLNFGFLSLSFSIEADMDINDTAIAQYYVEGEASKVVDILSGGSPLVTFFSGSRIA